MDSSFPQRGAEAQQRRGLSAGQQILERFENWVGRLAQLAQLTEEEQNDAGIHLSQLTEEEQMGAGISLGDRRGG